MTKRYNEYKDSGVEWLGEIPSHWDTIRLKDKISISSGKSATKTDEGYLLYGANGIIGRTNNYNIDRKKIIIGRVGSCGAINIAKERSFISDNALIVDEKSILFDYLYYILINKNLANLASKVAMPLITATGVLEEKSPFINDKNEQQAIATYLDNKTSKIDSAVSELEKQKSLLIELKKSTIHQAVTKGLDLTVPMKDSGVEWIGEVPSHWVVVRFKDLFDLKSTKHKFKKPTLFSLTMKGLKERDINSNEGQVAESYDKYNELLVGDFILNPMDLKSGFIDVATKDGIISPAYTMFTIKDKQNSKSFYKRYLQKHYHEKIFFPFGKGVSMEHRWVLTNRTLLFWPFLNVSKNEQIKIEEYLDKKTGQIDQSIEVIDNQIAKMKEYKKTLINDVVTGKIKVV